MTGQGGIEMLNRAEEVQVLVIAQDHEWLLHLFQPISSPYHIFRKESQLTWRLRCSGISRPGTMLGFRTFQFVDHGKIWKTQSYRQMKSVLTSERWDFNSYWWIRGGHFCKSPNMGVPTRDSIGLACLEDSVLRHQPVGRRRKLCLGQ